MSLDKEKILNAVAEMSVMDIIDLISMMEKKFGVSANNSISTVNTVTENTIESVEEKTEFDVILSAIGTNKIAVIKAVRSATNLSLKEAKDLTESAPTTIKENLNKDEAYALKKLLEDAGASVEVK